MKCKEWDRVRCSTSDDVNNKIDHLTLSNLREYEGKSKVEIDERIVALEKE